METGAQHDVQIISAEPTETERLSIIETTAGQPEVKKEIDLKVVIETSPISTQNTEAVETNGLALRPAVLSPRTKSANGPKISTSPAKSRPPSESRVRIEQDLGMDWRWYIKRR
jgi:hypothetical protein